MSKNFQALLIRENADGSFSRNIETRQVEDLPQGEVLIRVKYAGLNYKDALSASGHKGISKNYPHTPGVDAAGVVESDSTGKFEEGQQVLVTGYDLGMNTCGGFAEYVRVPAGWVVPLPAGISLRESMIMGTAAFTAALGLYKMELVGQSPEMGPLVVTGATGGVGSMAVAIYAKAGYEVIASSGKKDQYDYLKSLGASRCEGRDFTHDKTGRPLLRTTWAGGLDTVGGETLHTLVKSCARGGSIASCGLVATHDLNMTVYPFLLNGINLLGVDSAETAMSRRLEIWNKLATVWKIEHLNAIETPAKLDEITSFMDQILEGKTRGRVVVAM